MFTRVLFEGRIQIQFSWVPDPIPVFIEDRIQIQFFKEPNPNLDFWRAGSKAAQSKPGTVTLLLNVAERNVLYTVN